MNETKLITLVTEEEIKSSIIAKSNEYKDIYKGEKLIIVAELSGAFVFLADFIRELPLDVSIKFVAFDKVDGKKNITMDLETKTSFKERNVLILADVYNKGDSLQRLYDVVSEGEPKDIRILALANRANPNKNQNIKVEYLFEASDKKIVGYGLADHESYRGLKGLYYIDKGE